MGRGNGWRNCLLLGAALLVLSACANSPNGLEHHVVDADHLLSASTVDAIEQFPVTDNHALVVAVMHWDPNTPLGPQADDAIGRLSTSCDNDSLCQQKGIFVLLDPDGFPMLRVGSKLRLASMWGGATYGPQYVRAQYDAESMTLDGQATAFTEYAVDAVEHSTTHTSWFERAGGLTEKAGYENFATDTATTSYPGDGFYGHWIVRPFLNLQYFERDHVGTWWISVLLSALLAYGVVRLVKFAVRLLGKHWLRWPGLVVALAAAFAAFFLAIPISAAMVLQSGARLEDVRDVGRAFGDLPTFRFFTDTWAPARSVLLTVVVIVVGLARAILGGIDSSGPLQFLSSEQRHKLEDRDEIGWWEVFVAEHAEDNLDRELMVLAVAPLAFGLASYSILPAGLCVAFLLTWFVQVPFRALGAYETWRFVPVLAKFADTGDLEDPEPVGRPVKVGAFIAGGALAVAAAFGFAAGPDNVSASRDVPVVSTTTNSNQPDTTPPPPTVAPFVPETGSWSDWPTKPKTNIGAFATGDDVRYLQGVLLLRAGQAAVVINGVFDQATVDAVTAVQLFASLPPTGIVDAETWAVIDTFAVAPSG